VQCNNSEGVPEPGEGEQHLREEKGRVIKVMSNVRE
jgi:hypothetical protein